MSNIKKYLPTSILAGPYTYKITYESPGINLKSNINLGSTDHTNLKIYCNIKCNPTLLADTLLHEALHCIWYSQGLDPRTPVEEEIVVSNLATGLCSFIRNNPTFFDTIKKLMKLGDEHVKLGDEHVKFGDEHE